VSEVFVVDGFGCADVGEVEDVAFGDRAVVPGFGEPAVGGVVGELGESAVVVVSGRLAVGPPGVAFVDAGARQGHFARGAEAELIDDEDAGLRFDADVDVTFGVGLWGRWGAQMRMVTSTSMSGWRLRRYRW
jgi:hypothetical protein